MAKLKKILKKTHVIESCTKGRSNTKRRFFKLTNLTIFAALLRVFRWVARMRFYLNLFCEILQSIDLLTKKTPKKYTKTVFVSSEHLLSTWMEMRDSRKKHQSYSISFVLTVQILTLQSFKEFARMIFHLWKI